MLLGSLPNERSRKEKRKKQKEKIKDEDGLFSASPFNPPLSSQLPKRGVERCHVDGLQE
jgi:hypothetical protein